MKKCIGDNRMMLHPAVRYCIAVLLLCFLFMAFPRTDALGHEKKQILVLHSYNKGLDWTDNEDEGIMTVLLPHLDTIEVHTEFMDTKRVSIDEFAPDFLKYLQRKYATTQVECIITTDDDAFNFMLRYRQDLFPGVPVVFCGVNYLSDSTVAAGRDSITGVVEAFDIPATLRIALRLEPETSKVVVINDRTTTGIANRRILDAIIPNFDSRVKFDFLTDLSMPDLLGKVQTLKQGAIILLMTFNRDSTGHDFDYNQSLSLISQAAKVPIYGVWEFYLGKGIVGGMLTSGRIQGETAGKMALRILAGEKVKNIAILKESPNRFMFDYRQLIRFKIPFSRLPKSSLVVNKPQTFHQVHPQLFYGGIAAFISLLLIILLLLSRMHERRRSLKELEKAHRQTVTILESIADGFVAFDRDFRFTYVNNEAEKILGRNRDDLIGQAHWEVFPFTTGSPIDKFYRQVMETREAGELEYFHSLADRWENQWIALKAYPAEGGGISVYFRDITEKKKVDEELIRLATAIEQSAEAIFITDTKWIIRYVNPSFENMSGYPKNEIIGQHTRILKSDAHDSAFYRRIRSILEAGKVWSGRITSRKKDGSVFESEATDSPVRDASGNIINYVGVSRDITVEMRLEKELRQAQKMEAIGTLAGGIAHDFNNILSIIIGFTEMAKMKLPESSPIGENLQRVLDAGARATELVKQILTFSRWKEQEKKPVQIASFIKEALKLMRPLLPTTIEIRQEISVAPEQSIVLMDPTEIHQVLMNLCTNAAHAMQEKGGTLSVRVSELVADTLLVSRHLDLELGSYVCLSVSDTGIGMDASTVERIFDPYFTTKELGVGTGLGLPVVQGIVKGHHGAITVYSEPGKGTTFNVYLPRIEGGGLTSAIAQEVFPPGSESILFLDDEKHLAELGVEMLAPCGYKVTAMTNSRDALEIFRTNADAFDLVITDMTMPILTGKQLAAEIKTIRPDLPIILCTGFSELINETKAKDSGIDAFLMKPYAAGDLLRTIHRVLKK
jgi:PAS domain S-box-containing protein